MGAFVIVHARGGLCNRLRVALSYRSKHGPLGIVWLPDGEIAGARFDDVFCALPGVTFLTDMQDGIISTCDPCPDAPNGWQETYRLLELRADHRARYKSLRPSEPYSAVHIRRTDHDAIAAVDPTRDREFVDFISTAYQLVYIATDNGTTQRHAITWTLDADRRPRYASLIEEHEHQNFSGQRNTTLADAAIDLFMCAGADSFKGTRHSSFSNAVLMMKGLGGWWT